MNTIIQRVLKCTPALFYLLAIVLSSVGQTFAQDVLLVNAIAWNINGTLLAIGYQSGQVQIVDLDTQSIILTISDFSTVTALAWNPTEGNSLAVSGWLSEFNGVVQVYDSLSGQQLFSAEGGPSIGSLIWHPDGTQIAAAIDNAGVTLTARSEVRIWSYPEAQLLITAPAGSSDTITALSWSPNGQYIVGGKASHEILIWNANTGQLSRTLQGHLSAVTSVAWSPDGSKIASAGSILDYTIRVWDAITGNNLRIFPANAPLDISWSIDSDDLAIAENRAVRIIDASSGEEINVIQTNALGTSVTYSPYGGRLAFGGQPYLASSQLQQLLQSSAEITSENLAGGAVQIVVPDTSLERLEAIAAACDAPNSLIQPLANETQALSDEAVPVAALDTFVAQLDALPTDTIPPGCAADLRAVAGAIEAQMETP